MKLVILNKISEEKLTGFRNAVPGSVIESYPSPCDALSHVSDADAIAMWGFQNVQPFLEASPHVRWIHSLSDGVEHLLTKDMLKRPIILTNSHGIHDHAVADHTLALLLSLVRCLPIMIRQQDQKIWKRPKTDSLYQKTVAIIGYGSIGKAIAQRIKGFNTKILAVKKHISDDPFTDQVYTADQIKDVLPKADITIAALPSTPETNEFFGKKEFSLMKKTSFFINIARASVVNENALVEALSEHRIAGAALDVFEKEPLPENHPFWSMENVIISPHSASFTPDSWNHVLELLKNNFIAFSKGEKLTNEINKTKGY